jgi:hypothetical protein
VRYLRAPPQQPHAVLRLRHGVLLRVVQRVHQRVLRRRASRAEVTPAARARPLPARRRRHVARRWVVRVLLWLLLLRGAAACTTPHRAQGFSSWSDGARQVPRGSPGEGRGCVWRGVCGGRPISFTRRQRRLLAAWG